MASFPTSVKNYGADLVDGVDYPQADHINSLRAEVTAIEDGYVNATAPLNSSGSTVATLHVTGASTFAGKISLTSTGGLRISSGTPAETSNVLYNIDGALYFNGAAVGVSSNSTFANVSVETNCTIAGGLTVTGGVTIPSTSAIAARLTHDAAQEIAANAWTGLSFNTEDLLQGLTHSTGAGSSALTVDTAGVYVLGGSVWWNSTNRTYGVRIVKNDTTVLGMTRIGSDGASTVTVLTISAVAALSTGDTIGLGVFTGGSTNRVNASTEFTPILWAAKVGV